MLVIAKGASYFVQPQEPKTWRFLDLLGIDCVIAPSAQCAVLATYTDVVTIDRGGSPLWRRTVAVDGVEIEKIQNGLIYGRAGIDPPDEWHRFVLRLDDGTEAEPGASANGGPAKGFGDSGAGVEPPSVS